MGALFVVAFWPVWWMIAFYLCYATGNWIEDKMKVEYGPHLTYDERLKCNSYLQGIK